jgi:hypothetical protein
MELFETQLIAVTSKKPEDQVKRLLIQMIMNIQETAEKIKRIKDKEDLNDFVDRVLSKPHKPKLFQDIAGISDMMVQTKEGLVKVREAQRKRQEREAKKAAAVAPLTVINNYTVIGTQNIVGMKDGPVDKNPRTSKHVGSQSGGVRKGIPKSVRNQSWDRWIGSKHGLAPCYCCRINQISKAQFECGHVVPDVLGGRTTVENLRPICLPCNRSMSATDMRDFCKKFYRENLD